MKHVFVRYCYLNFSALSCTYISWNRNTSSIAICFDIFALTYIFLLALYLTCKSLWKKHCLITKCKCKFGNLYAFWEIILSQAWVAHTACLKAIDNLIQQTDKMWPYFTQLGDNVVGSLYRIKRSPVIFLLSCLHDYGYSTNRSTDSVKIVQNLTKQRILFQSPHHFKWRNLIPK